MTKRLPVESAIADLVLCRGLIYDLRVRNGVSDKVIAPSPTSKVSVPPTASKLSELVTRSLSSTNAIVENYTAAIEAKPGNKT